VRPQLEERAEPAVGPSGRDAALAGAAARLRRYLRFLGCDRSQAEDCAQEALLAALARFGPGSGLPPLPWLLTAARNGYRMHLRRKCRRREVDDLDALHQAWVEVAGPDAADERLGALRLCLAELPARSRRALELRYGDGAPRGAIGKELGLGDEGVKSLLARLRALLAACVRRRIGS
jgi:RNA polymerase sigma-70 factor (ECF subfamily)